MVWGYTTFSVTIQRSVGLLVELLLEVGLLILLVASVLVGRRLRKKLEDKLVEERVDKLVLGKLVELAGEELERRPVKESE